MYINLSILPLELTGNFLVTVDICTNMLKAAKIESNMSKLPDSSTQNIDQENLLVEFIRENNSNKNDNCTNSCQNISNQLMFERMILNHFHNNA